MEGMNQISDAIVPEIFSPTVQQITQEKSALIASGAMVVDGEISANLAGPGLTFNTPSYRDLDNDEENISNDGLPDKYTGGNNDSSPNKIAMANEISVRLSRNNSWGTMDLVSALNATDPADAIAQRVGSYWVRRLQRAFVATVKGVFADNEAAPTGSDTHSINDMTNDVTRNPSDGSVIPYQEDVTSFTGEGFLDACLTMGDSMEDLQMIQVHSVVLNRMQKKDMIKYLKDSDGTTMIPTYLGRRVIVDDTMPSSDGFYESWLFGSGAIRFGTGSPKQATATRRDEDAGNGGGAEILYNRLEWCLHPRGHRFQATPPSGGPGNGAEIGGLANADSWSRVYSERKQIPIARYITREHG